MKKNNLMEYIFKVKSYFIFSIFFAIINVISSILLPIYIGNAIDKIDIRKDIKTEIVICIFLIILSTTFSYLMNIFAKKGVIKLTNKIKNKALNSIYKAKISETDKYLSGDLTNRIINSATIMQDGLMQFLVSFIPGILTISFIFIAMASISLQMALLIALIAPFSTLITYYISKNSLAESKKQQKLYNEISGNIKEKVDQIEYIKAMNTEDEVYEKYRELSKNYVKNGKKALFYSSITNPFTRFLNGMSMIVVCFRGVSLVTGKILTIGNFTSFIFYSNHFSKPFNEISSGITQLVDAITAFNNLTEIINLEEEKSIALEELKDVKGKIEFKNVDFSYNEDSKFIKSLNLDINAKEKVAIVGKTGSGKTTLMNLLMNFYSLNGGSIFIDGKNIKEISLENLRKNLGIVLQDAWLTGETVRENITYGTKISDDEITERLEEIGLNKDTLNLPDGYDTILRNGGNNLSSGQRQLICLARIIVAKPEIIILDEASSDLDAKTEKVMQDALNKLMKEHTSIIVAHRLSTIENADKIVVMKNGRIVESGRHKELIENGKEYKEIYNSQFTV